MINLSIKQKLLSLAGLMIVSFITVGAIYGYSISIQDDANMENDRIITIEQNVKNIHIGLLEARRNEKDFLLRSDLKYAGKHQKTMESNHKLVDTLKDQISNKERARHIDELGKLFVEYESGFTKLVKIKQTVGLDEKQGLLGNLRKSVHDVEDNLKQYSNDKMTVSMLMMRRHEKDYLAREDEKYIDNMKKEQQVFAELLEESNLPTAIKASIANQMSVYYRDFIALTDGMKGISAEIEDMRNSAHRIEPIFDTVINMMEELHSENSASFKATHEKIVTIMVSTLAIIGVLAVLLVWYIAQGIIKAVNTSVQVAEKIAGGDLLSNIEVTTNDEMGKLQLAMKSMVERLRSVVGAVRESSQSVLQASNEISSGNMELSQRTEEQASSLEETASSMEEMTTTVKESADNALQANKLANSTRDEAKKGGEVVGRAVQAMNDIRNSSKKIVDIINVVEDIAFQTNLLALNAAVEAARAGEQGRGFAVVASEVRTLAGRSAESAKEIRNLIEDSVDKVQTGSELVDASGETLNQIVNSVAKVADIVSEMAAASQEQSAGIEQVNKAVMQMDQMTQQNSALVEEAASASRALQDQAIQLDQIISFFKVEESSVLLKHSAVMNYRQSMPADAPKYYAASAPAKSQEVNKQKAASTTVGKKTGTYDSDWDEF